MEKSKEEPHIIDYDSDSDEFSDAIDTHADFKAEDDFFDVPEWREEKTKMKTKMNYQIKMNPKQKPAYKI